MPLRPLLLQILQLSSLSWYKGFLKNFLFESYGSSYILLSLITPSIRSDNPGWMIWNVISVSASL